MRTYAIIQAAQTLGGATGRTYLLNNEAAAMVGCTHVVLSPRRLPAIARWCCAFWTKPIGQNRSVDKYHRCPGPADIILDVRPVQPYSFHLWPPVIFPELLR